MIYYLVVVRVSGSGDINLPTPVGNAGGRISFYFETDCTLNTTVWGILLERLHQAVQHCLLCVASFEKTSGMLLVTEQTGLLCGVQAMFRPLLQRH
jgi:hypothetical protein